MCDKFNTKLHKFVTETFGKTLGKLWENFGKTEVRGFPKLKNFGNFFPKLLGDYFLKGGFERGRARSTAHIRGTKPLARI